MITKEEKEKLISKKEKEIAKKYIYTGETGKSGYKRIKQHVDLWKNMKDQSFLFKHYSMIHPEKEMKEMMITSRILKNHRTAFNRQIEEAITIKLNSKVK